MSKPFYRALNLLCFAMINIISLNLYNRFEHIQIKYNIILRKKKEINSN